MPKESLNIVQNLDWIWLILDQTQDIILPRDQQEKAKDYKLSTNFQLVLHFSMEYSSYMAYPPTLPILPVQYWLLRAGTGYIQEMYQFPYAHCPPLWLPL